MKIKVVKTEKDWEIVDLICDFNYLADVTRSLLKDKKIDRNWVRANQAEMKRILNKIRELELSQKKNPVSRTRNNSLCESTMKRL